MTEFERVGIAGRVHKVNGTETNRKYFNSETLTGSERHIATALSHLDIIREAQKAGLENVLIFEDDLKFVNWDPGHIKQSVEALEAQNWKLYYLGYNLWGRPFSPERVSDHLYSSPKGYDLRSTHAYSVHQRAYGFILDHYDPFRVAKRIDMWLPREIDHYILSPLMCVQDQIDEEGDKAEQFLRQYQKHLPEAKGPK